MANIPPLAVTSRLVARSLGLTATDLTAALQPASLADLGDLVAFRATHLGARITWDDSAYLLWRYRLGRLDEGFGDVWTVRKNGELLGIVGTEDMQCTDGSAQIRGQRLMDLLILPTLADSGLGTWLNQTLFDKAGFTLAVGANRFSQGLVARLFEPLSPMLGLVRPFRFDVQVKRLQTHALLRSLALACANTMMSAWTALLSLQGRHGIELRPIEQFEAGPETLPMCALYGPGNVQLVRSGDFLNRRLLANPRVQMEVMGAFRNGHRVGYIAWHSGGSLGTSTDLRIFDWHLSGDRPLQTWGVLLRCAIATARQRGCGGVRIAAQRAEKMPLRRRHGFLSPPGRTQVLVGLHEADGVGQWSRRPWALNTLCDDTHDQ